MVASVGSASFISDGEAEVMEIPKGTPLLSATTMHFEPLPRLVFPTSGPPFLPVRTSHR